MQNNNGISVERAVEKLREQVDLRTRLPVKKIINIIKILASALVYALVLFVFELLFVYYPTNNINPMTAVFLAGNAILIANLAHGLRKEIGTKKSRAGILLGRSYRRITASPGIDGKGTAIEVGTDGMYYIDYINEPNHHVLINGSTSSGKTVTMLALAARASLSNGIRFLMIDWNGENEEWARSVGATVWSVPSNFKVNLFKLNGMTKEARSGMAVESLALAARLTALQSTKVKSILLRFYSEGREPSLFELWDALCSRNTGKESILSQRLRAIQRVIGYEPEEFWKCIFTRNNVISLSGLNESEKSLVVYSIIQRLSEIFDRKPELKSKPQLMVVIDEAWQFFKREKELDVHKESSLERVVRLGRKYGFGLVISTQQLDDVPKVFINSCSLIMLHQQREYSYYGKDVLGLDGFESSYLKTAGQGEMLLFDRGMAQSGHLHSDYIKVMPLTNEETGRLTRQGKRYTPEKISEPEMPIEMHDRSHGFAEYKEKGVLDGIDVPSVAVYRFMVALRKTRDLAPAYKLLREKGWLTSGPSIYGGMGKPSILARAVSYGYADEKGMLTEKGNSIVDPDRLIANQGVLSGGEEHKELMRRTIAAIQEKGNFAFVPKNKDSFDVGELLARSRRTWDMLGIKIYECQTNAIGKEIEKCIGRAKAHNTIPIIVVVSDEIKRQVNELAGGSAECIKL